MIICCILSDSACDLAVRVLLELDERQAVAEFGIAVGLDMLHENTVDRDCIVIGILVLLVRTVTCRVGFIPAGIINVADAAFKTHIILAAALEDTGQPVDHRSGLIDPHFDQIAVNVAAAVANEFLQGFHLIDCQLRHLLDLFLLNLGINRTDILTDRRRCLFLFDDKSLEAFFSSGQSCDPATGSETYDKALSVNSLGDTCLIDFRGFAEPLVSFLFMGTKSDFLSCRLRNTVDSCFADRVRCDCSAGYRVYIRALCADNFLCHLGTDYGADIRCLTCAVDRNVRDHSLIERHRDSYGACETLLCSCVGTGCERKSAGNNIAACGNARGTCILRCRVGKFDCAQRYHTRGTGCNTFNKVSSADLIFSHLSSSSSPK